MILEKWLSIMQGDSRVRLGRGASMRGKAESGGFLSYDAMKVFFMGDGERGRFAAGVGRESNSCRYTAFLSHHLTEVAKISELRHCRCNRNDRAASSFISHTPLPWHLLWSDEGSHWQALTDLAISSSSSMRNEAWSETNAPQLGSLQGTAA